MIPLIGSLSFATGASVFKFDPTDIILLNPILDDGMKQTFENDNPTRKDDSLNYQIGAHLYSWWKRLFWDASVFCALHKTKVLFATAPYAAGVDLGGITFKSFLTYGAQIKVGYRHRSHLPGLYFTTGFSDMLLSVEKMREAESLGSETRHYITPFWGFGFSFPVLKMCHAFVEFQHKISPSQKIVPDKTETDVSITQAHLDDFKAQRGYEARVKLSHWRFLCGAQFHLLRNKDAV